ncbi:MAG TPA: PAS domain S-box protein, partial [Anaerolineales bacterium]
ALVETVPASNARQLIQKQLVAEFKVWVLSDEFLDLFLLEPGAGKVILGVQPDWEGQSKADRAYFLEGRKALYTSPIYFSPKLATPTMVIAAPIFAEDGELLAVLAGRLNLDELSNIVQRRSGLRESDDAFLVNASRLVVTQPRFIPDPAVLRQAINTVPVNRCVQQKSGTVFANDYRDVPVIASYRWIPDQQMCLIVKISQAEAFAAIQHLQASLFGIVLATLVVASAVAHALSRTIVRPLRAMQQTAQRYGRGELDVRLPETRHDELGVLAHEFNQMAILLRQKEQDLEEHARTLEQNVQERTRDLLESNSQLQRAEETGQVGSWFWYVSENHLVVSEGLYKLMGLTPPGPGAAMNAFLQCIHPQDQERVQRIVADALEQGGSLATEFRIVLADGQVRTLYARGECLLDERGAPLQVNGAVIDITERKQAEMQLADAHKFLQHVLTSAPIGIFTYRLSGECLSANAAAAEMVGATIEELESQNFHEIESWKRSGLYDLAQQAIFSKELIAADVHVLTTFGRDAWYRAKYVTFKSKGEEILLMIFEDITERKQADAALEASEKRFRTWIENSSDIVTVLDAAGVIQYESPSAKRLLDYCPEELLGRKAFDFIHPEDQNRIISAFAESLQNPDSTVSAEFRFLHRDGSWRFLEGSSRAYLDEHGEVVGLIHSRDITQRREAEAALDASERRFRTWIENSSDVVSVIDAAGIIQYESPSIKRLLNYCPEELLGKNAFDFVHPEDQAGMIASFAENVEALNSSWHAEYRFRHRDGSWRFLEGIARSYQDEDGQVVGLVHSRDITERKQAEQALREKERLLSE